MDTVGIKVISRNEINRCIKILRKYCINSVYVFDDRVVLNFNFTDDAKTVTREEVLGSSAVDNAPPKQEPLTLVRGFFVASSTNPRQSRTVQNSNSTAPPQAGQQTPQWGVC